MKRVGCVVQKNGLVLQSLGESEGLLGLDGDIVHIQRAANGPLALEKDKGVPEVACMGERGGTPSTGSGVALWGRVVLAGCIWWQMSE